MSTKVEIGVMQKLLITEVTAAGRTIFVQLDTPEAYQVQDLSREIESHILELKAAHVNFEPGSRCYARASDGVLYRALIVSRSTTTSATLYFVDYGNSEDVEVSNIFPPSGNFFDLPTQALCCTLADFIPSHSKWSDAILSILIEKLLNQEVYGIFRSQSSNTHPYQAAVLQDKCPCYNVTLYQDESGESSYSELLVISGLGQFATCSENVSVGMEAKVYVSFSDSPGRFWLQLASNTSTLESIANCLADVTITSSLQPLSQDAIYSGVACCAVFHEDGAYYRAQVIEVAKGGKVEVQFVDYGNSTSVCASDLFALPPKLCSIPAQAVQCCLEGVRPMKKDWTNESCDVFASGTINIELDAQFVDELMPEVFNVVLRNPEIGSNVSEVLISNGCAQSSDPPPLLSETPPTRLIPTPPTQSLPKEYTPLKMDVGESYELTVTFMESPSVVWGQLSKFQQDFTAMMSKMTSLFKNVSAIPGLQDSAPGQPCAAQFSADKQWYRGKIEAIDDPTKRAKVVFVDFGNPNIFKLSSLKQLPPELLVLPMQAVSFSMHDLAPADGGKVWPVTTQTSFLKLTSSGVLQCEVVELDSDGYPAARLKDGRGCDVGEELVHMKLARWKENRRSREPVKSYRQHRPSGERSTRGSVSQDGSTRGSGSRDGSTRGSGSQDGSTRGSGSQDRSVRGSGSRDGSMRTGGSRDVSMRGSASWDRPQDLNACSDSTARGSSPPIQIQHSPQQSEQQSQFQSNAPSPLRTGTGPTPLHQSKSQHYSTQRLEVGLQYSLSVVHVESLQDFYVQLSDQATDLVSVMDEIAAHCSSDTARMPRNLEPGKPVLAQFTNDQEWYRAVITKRNQGVSMVTFVDYGNTDTLQDSSLIEIPSHLLSLPAQAIHCSLSGVGVQVSAEAAKTTFTDLTLEQEAQAEVQSVLMDSTGPVYAIDLSLADGRKPITALIEGGHVSIPRSTLSNLSPTSSPTLAEVKFPSFPAQSHIDVCVSFVETPAKFFVQLLENAHCLEELMRGMHEVYSNMSQRDEVLFSLDTGVFCAAKFSEDRVWYRARIVSLDGATARVQFIDYGNEETVAASDLKCLRVQFAAESCLAIQCTLEGLSLDIAQSQVIVDTFSKIVANKKFIGKFLKPFTSYSEAIPIQLFDTNQSGMDQDIAKMLVNLHSNAGPSQSENRSAKVTMRPATSESGMTHSQMAIPLPQPEINRPLDCTVTCVESPAEVYCQLQTATPLAEVMLESLYTFYAEENAGEVLKNPEVGMACAAPFTDSSWYRAKIIALNAEFASACVQYMDYGNSAEVPVSDLRVLDPQFSSEPLHSLKCLLNGIQPIENENEWKKECCTKLSEAILEQKCVVTVLEVKKDTFDVQLTLAGSDIAQVLIRDGFAEVPKTSLGAKTVPTIQSENVSAKVTMRPTTSESGMTHSQMAIPLPRPEINQPLECTVTCVESPAEVYCQLQTATPLAEGMLESLYTFYAEENAGEVLKNPEVGMACAAPFTDGSWYRAKIIALNAELATAHYVDYGNSAEVPVSDLRVLDPQFSSEPLHSLKCLLSGIQPIGKENEWKKECCTKLSEAILEQKCIVTVLELNDDTFDIQLTVTGSDIAQVLIRDHFAEAKVSPKTSLGAKTVLNIPLSQSENGSAKVTMGPTTSESGMTCSQMAIPLPQPEINQPLECTVTCVESPAEVYCQLQTVTPLAEVMLDSLYTFYAEENAGEVLANPEVGMACAAPFTDGSWYRAKIIALNAELATAHYVDYGNSAEVPVSDLRVLDPQFCSEPLHALKCFLNGIQPIDKENKWKKECCTKLSEAILEQKCVVTVLEVKNDTFDVQLTVTGSDITQVVIQGGFAEVRTSPVGAKAVPTTITIPPFQAQVGEELDVFVTYSASPLDICCQPSELGDSFTQLTEDLQRFCRTEEAHVVEVESLRVGDVVLAQFSVDQAWYRAKVLSISDDKKSAKVMFVDYGNPETTSVIRSISADFCSLPAQATCCSILGGDDYTLGLESEVAFNELLTTDENGFHLRFVEVGTEKAIVQLSRLSDGGAVLQHACDKGILVKKKASLSKQEAGYESEISVSGFEGTDDMIALKPVRVLEVSGFLPVVVETGLSEDGFVSHFETPSSFWVQLASNEGELETLTERIAAVYGDAVELEKLALPDPKPGQVCCAQFSDDKQWYRSIVDVVDSCGVTVHFVDYGNGETVTTNRVRLLRQEFLDIPVQAVHCSLMEIGPPSGTMWRDESIACFAGSVLNSTVTVEFVDDSSGVWLVRLSSHSEDVAMAMVTEGVAASKKPSDVEVFTNLNGPPQNFICLEETPVIIPELEFKEGDSLEVYISHLTDTLTEFYCQLADNEASIDELMASVSDFYTENSPPATLEVGSFCVAQYSGNNSWYRAKIFSVEDSDECTGIMVHFVDFGNYETVLSSQVLGLHQNLAALASQAICCSLTADLSLQLSAENVTRFMSLDLKQCYRVSITSCLGNRYVVELSDLDGTILNERFLVTKGADRPSDAVTSAYKSLLYAVSSTLDVYVSYINSPTSFYCQPLQLAADLETMMSELAETILSTSPPEVKSVAPGIPCLAKFSEDEEWYRAKILEVLEDDKIIAHFVDYGNSEVTSVAALHVMPDALMKEPIQALHCSVFDASISITWTDERIEEFRSILGDEALSLTISSVDADTGLCVCSLSSNGAPIDFSSLLPATPARQEAEMTSVDEGSVAQVLATSEEIVTLPGMERLSDQPYASGSSTLSLPTAGVTTMTSDGRLLEHSAGTSEDGVLESNLGTAITNISMLALKGSSHGSEDISDTESSEEVSDQGDGEGEPLIKAPFLLTLSIPEQFEATVVFVESPSLLYLQRVDCQSELEKLSTEIEQYCVSFAEKQHQENFQKGDFVLAQYSDDAWYRAKVVDAGKDSNVHVFFIDFGNSESIAPDKMVMCPENYLELPCQAIACSLAKVPRRDSWPDEYKNLIDEQVGERVMKVGVVHPASEGMRPTVSIEDSETGSDIAQKVLDYLQDECDRGNLSNYVIPEEPEREIPDDSDGESSPSLQATPKAEASLLMTDPLSKCVVPERVLDVESSYEVYLVSCENPHSFMLQLVSETDALEEMSTALEAIYENKNTSPLTLQEMPVVGDFVCGQYSADSKWYRAKVVSLEADGKVDLLFIDFGNSEESELSSIRALDPSLPSHPAFAIECFLAGVEPPTDTEGFGVEASEHFLEVTGHAESSCMAEVLFADSARHYGVNLFGVEGTNIAQSLVDAHLATPLQDTPTTATSASQSDDITPRAESDQSEPVTTGVAPTVANQPELPLLGESPLSTDDVMEEKKEEKELDSVPEENSSDQFATMYPAHSLHVGSIVPAHVTSITSLDEFQCQLIENLEALDAMMESIAMCQYQIADNLFTVAEPREGLPVCACFSDDDAWYRAEITTVLSQERVRVSYIDYGNTEDIDISRVKRLKKEFAEALPPVVVTCSLAPLTDRDLDPSRPFEGAWDLVWPKECLSHFRELVEDSEVELVCEGSEEGGVLSVKVMVGASDGEQRGEGEGGTEQRGEGEGGTNLEVESDSVAPQSSSDLLEGGSSKTSKLDVRAALVSKLLALQASSREQTSREDDGRTVAEMGREEDGEKGGVEVTVESDGKTGSQPEKQVSSTPTVAAETTAVVTTTDPSEEVEEDARLSDSKFDRELDEIARDMVLKAIYEAEKDSMADNLSQTAVNNLENVSPGASEDGNLESTVVSRHED